MSLTDKVLETARGFTGPFTKEDLAYGSWMTYPLDFALKGYICPDSHRVYAYLFGERGLVKCGYLERLPDGRYQVATEPVKAAAPPLSDHQKQTLAQCLESRAYGLFLEGSLQKTTLADAFQFWGCNAHCTGPMFRQQKASFDEGLKRVGELVKGEEIRLDEWNTLTADLLGAVKYIAQVIEKQFARHIETMLRRQAV